MATENKGVMIYLPPDVEEYVTEYCITNDITRKGKDGESIPSLGTGVVTFLRSAITGEAPSEILGKKRTGGGLSRDDVLSIVNEYVTGHSVPPDLTARVEAIEQVIAAVPTEESLRELVDDAIELRSAKANAQALSQQAPNGNGQQKAQALPIKGVRVEPMTPASDGNLTGEDEKMVKRLEANPGLRAAAAEAIAQGGTGKEIADRLLEADHGPGNGKAFDPSVITRMRKAIAHLESTGG